MMQFAALSLLLMVAARCRPSCRKWLTFSALAVGLSAGTKFTGALLLLPLFINAFQLRSRDGKPFHWILLCIRLGFIFIFAYLFTTPGTLLHPTFFYRGFCFEVYHYSIGHYGYTVEAGMDHLLRNLRYLCESLFSHYPALSLFSILLSLLGIFALFKDSPSLAIFLLCFPLVYLPYLGMQKVMFVRNLLVLAPFLAIFAARGAAFLWMILTWRFSRFVLAAAVASLLIVNATWLFYAAQTIQDRGTDRFISELNEYISSHSGTRFYVSPKVRTELENLIKSSLSNITFDTNEKVDRALFYPEEVMEHLGKWPSNRPGLTVACFGPWEVNFEYYTTWEEPRIVLVNEDVWQEFRTLK
jgi:hypothetical protein